MQPAGATSVMRTTLQLAIILGALAAATGCEGLPAGPSLNDVVISNLRTQSTIGDNNLCCCHVLGTARNNNGVALHATLKFAVLDANQEEISRVIYFIENFQPGASHQIEAGGFIFECARVRSIKYEVSVRGLTSPPAP
jgi:hypothetical protein